MLQDPRHNNNDTYRIIITYSADSSRVSGFLEQAAPHLHQRRQLQDKLIKNDRVGQHMAQSDRLPSVLGFRLLFRRRFAVDAGSLRFNRLGFGTWYRFVDLEWHSKTAAQILRDD